MTAKALLKQLEDERMEAFRLCNHYDKRATEERNNGLSNWAAYYDRRFSEEMTKVENLRIAINIIRERVS